MAVAWGLWEPQRVYRNAGLLAYGAKAWHGRAPTPPVKNNHHHRRMTSRTAARANGSHLRLAADIGGTFTDIAVFDDRTGKLSFGKALSTPQRLVEGINAGVAKAESDYKSAGLFLHGSTIAINTILERKGAKTALLITDGFRDVYEIGRINRPDAYNLFFQKHEPLVERALRFEVKERMLSDGEIETPLDEAEIEAFGRMLDGLGVEATAILFLNCYARHDHEARAKAILEKNHPAMFVSASHELSEEYREFERCSTVVSNAYVGPIVRRYIGEIDDHIRDEGFHGSFLIVQSTGGLYEAEQAKKHCVHMLESGPAAGGKATFGGDVRFASGDPSPTGNVRYIDHVTGDDIKATSFSLLMIDDSPCGPNTHANIKGKATVNGVADQDLTIDVNDCGTPGSTPAAPDTLTISTGPSQVYANSGPLMGGNIRVTKAQ